MPLEKTFRRFTAGIRLALSRVEELQLTVDDKPAGGAAVVDHFEYAVADLQGWLSETLESAQKAGNAATRAGDLDGVRRALATCQERFQRVDQVLSGALLSYDRLQDLTSFGNEHRGEWPSWVTSIKQGVEHCRQALEPARIALAECWQEIAERSGATSIQVRTSNVGQKIVARTPEEATGVTREGLT